jgi:putative hemolysin
MIAFSIVLLVIGVLLSALFSGIETGFYRASRVRIVMAGLDGDRISRALVRLLNNPTWFVATTLVGNNVANYLTSLSIVLLTNSVAHSNLAEMLAPILFSPLLFVYGELLPKSLFFQAPNLLLRGCAPAFLLFSTIFAPAVALLWAMSQILERSLGQSPQRIRLILARKELQQVLEEGLEAGILLPTQRHLAQNFFLNASKPISSFCIPMNRVLSVNSKKPTREVIKFARKNRLDDVPVFDEKQRKVTGYIRTIDLLMEPNAQNRKDMIRKMIQLRSNELFGEAVLQMQAAREKMANVVDANGHSIGLLSIDHLTNPLLVGPLDSLRR